MNDRIVLAARMNKWLEKWPHATLKVEDLPEDIPLARRKSWLKNKRRNKEIKIKKHSNQYSLQLKPIYYIVERQLTDEDNKRLKEFDDAVNKLAEERKNKKRIKKQKVKLKTPAVVIPRRVSFNQVPRMLSLGEALMQ